MPPTGQGQTWSDVLCCFICGQMFSAERLPKNLACGHVICSICIKPEHTVCPVDEAEGQLNCLEYPTNVALLSICTNKTYSEQLSSWSGASHSAKSCLSRIEHLLVELASYLRRAESERGGTVFSEVLSRTMQRKLIALLCFQLVEEEGRSRALKSSRALTDRIVTEILSGSMGSSHLSTQLWTAVRARGCQFLGPAMQEDVLKLILLALGQGAPIARKTLVIYVVQMLTEDYPQVSKTCVGHVVQLLYRASCFHVIKRDGESSLMQLKEEFREYENLRKEHDAQIVQMAMEAGLRITPDQWSSLLYGDVHHRSHMQSIIDKLQSPQSFQQAVDDLITLANKGDEIITEIIPHVKIFMNVHPTHHTPVTWNQFLEYLESLAELFHLHRDLQRRRTDQKQKDGQQGHWKNRHEQPTVRYKTKMCRDVIIGQACPRGNRCTWAHSSAEIQESQQTTRTVAPTPTVMQPKMAPPSAPTTAPMIPNPQPMFQPQPMGPVPPMPVQNVQLIHAPAAPPNGFPQMHPVMAGPAPGEVVPLVPMMVQSPARQHQMAMPPPHMVLVPHPQPPPNVIMASNPVNGGMWQGAMQNSPMVLQQPHSSPPHHAYWFPQNPNFPMENGHPMDEVVYGWSRMDLNNSRPDQDADQLFMKRKEILSRLAPLTLTDDEDDNDNVGHVSYTVASSVLDERMELHQHPLVMIGGPPPLELPPIPTTFSAVSCHNEDNMVANGDIVTVNARGLQSNIPYIQVPTVIASCPDSLLTAERAPSATVQSDCSAMHVRDVICQPLPTVGIQPTQIAFIPAAIDPCTISEPLRSAPPVSAVMDPQGVVSTTLDKIVDVKERLNEAEGAPMSSAISQQLRVELRIAEREMDSLDPRTQASCLLRELQQVDRELERIEATRPIEQI